MPNTDPMFIPGLTPYLQMKKYMEDRGQVEQQRGLQNEFIQKRAALGPDATPEQLTGLALQYTNPAETAHLGSTETANKQKYEYFNSLLDSKLEQIKNTHEVNMARVKDAEARTYLTQGKNEAEAEIKRMQLELDRMYKMSRLDIERQKVNQGGKPPSGYRQTTEGNLEAIPGGPADTKLQGQLNQDTANLNESLSNMDRLASEANAIKEHPGLGGITGLRGVVPNIPGGQPANAQARLDTLKSQVAFGVLQNMRNNSKTGGALGQVSNIEEKMLMDNLAGLGRAQSKEEYQNALQRIIDYTNGAKDRLRAAYNLKHGEKSTPSSLPDASAIDAEIRRRQGGR